MDEVIWVEVLSRHRGVVSRHRCVGRVVRIGRAYTNDVVLDDPYVAPEHVHILPGEYDTLVVEDLGSTNGLFAAHGRTRHRRIVLDHEGVFRIGHTFLRVRRAAHAVAPERRIASPARSWPLLAALAIVVLALEALSLWLDDFAELRAATYVMPLVGMAVAIAVWTALWTLASRLFAGHGWFERNLAIALSGALALEIVSALSEIGAFGLSWSALATYSYVGLFCVLAAMGVAHLHFIAPARTMANTAIVVGLLVAAVTIQTVMQSDARPGAGRLYVRNLQPPALRLAPVEDEASFFAGVETLRGKLDKDRDAAP
jgi:FHA domain